jgi:hypothetical protein
VWAPVTLATVFACAALGERSLQPVAGTRCGRGGVAYRVPGWDERGCAAGRSRASIDGRAADVPWLTCGWCRAEGRT